MITDNQLLYTKHVNALYKRVGGKVKALQGISSYLTDRQRKAIATSFVASETNYCSLIWGFGSKTCAQNYSVSRIEP